MKIPLLVLIQIMIISIVECTPCTRARSLDITGGTVNQNGSVIYDGLEYKSGAWYEVVEDSQTIRLGCPCLERVCLWKCCDAGLGYLGNNCTNLDILELNPFSPPVYKGRERVNVEAHKQFFYMYGGVPCSDVYPVQNGFDNVELYLQENGTLLESTSGGAIWNPSGDFCLDMKLENVSQVATLVGRVCFPDEDNTDVDSPLLYTAYAIGLLLSVPFLLATFLVYAMIPELRNMHGMCLMAYCAGLIVAYPALAYLKLHVGTIGVAMTGCLTVAFIVYYAFQTSFFWLNVMCFDIWRTFSTYRGGSVTKRREKKRFILYAAYAWGVPLLLTLVTVAMQFSDLPSYIITPGFGSRKCWFSDWPSETLYFFIPVLALVVCNTALFSVTAHRIRTIRQETAILKGSESSRSDKLQKDKQRYGLYLKLFMVMGVNWSVEIISFVVGGSNWYWVVVDISNIALGIFVFFIFVWKKKVRNLVQKKYRTMFGMQQTEQDSNRKWMSSSAPTEDTRISSEDSAIRLKDMH